MCACVCVRSRSGSARRSSKVFKKVSVRRGSPTAGEQGDR